MVARVTREDKGHDERDEALAGVDWGSEKHQDLGRPNYVRIA